ncbi:MAG: hypothetical protein HQ462_07570, partial [Deltaproteobacteria bacterium]|nr:hypothetical protein [Deltaproteobacteria bacterium]
MLHIYWIKLKGRSLDPQLKTFIEGVGTLNASLETFELTHSTSEPTQFFNGLSLKTANVVFISGFTNSNFAEIVTALRIWSGLQRPIFPICLLSSSQQKANLENALSLGFDDFIVATESPSIVLERIKLRLHLIMQQVKQEKVMQEQVAKNAKTETILSQREEFLSVCAHDLRSPLGLIQSSLSLVLNSSENNLTEIQKELIHRARRQSGDAINLVSDLLDVMSFEQGLKPQYQLFSLDNLLRPFYKDYQFQAQQ